MTIWMLVIALGVLAILAVAVRMSMDLRAIRAELLPDLHSAVLNTPAAQNSLQTSSPLMVHHPHSHSAIHFGCFIFWQWREGRWGLYSDGLPPDVGNILPPAAPGKYDGEIVKIWVPGRRG